MTTQPEALRLADDVELNHKYCPVEVLHEAAAELRRLHASCEDYAQRKPLTDEEIDAATAQERDALLDHIYEYGTAAEGVLERIRKLCRAAAEIGRRMK